MTLEEHEELRSMVERDIRESLEGTEGRPFIGDVRERVANTVADALRNFGDYVEVRWDPNIPNVLHWKVRPRVLPIIVDTAVTK